jgi:hypothetical protein
MEMDEEFWQGIEVEEKVRGGLVETTSSSGATASGPPASRPQRQVAQAQPPQTAAPTREGRGGVRRAAADIIELDDSDEEKENVNTRLRRRAPAPSGMVDTIDLSDWLEVIAAVFLCSL